MVIFRTKSRTPQTRHATKRAFGRVKIWTLAGIFAIVAAQTAQADRSHTVKRGQTLSDIARKYSVSVHALSAANKLKSAGAIYIGQTLRVPDPGIIYVRKGDTLARLAARHNTTKEKLASQNGIKLSTPLVLGQRLKLPGYKRIKRERSRWGTPKRPGRLDLYRIATRERMKILVLDKRGRVRSAATRRLQRLLRSRNRGRTRRPNKRLIKLLADVSDHFGGRQIQIVSGYRPAGGRTKRTSRHTNGRAIDFRIPGVPLRALRNYCRRLPNAGVGYYPTSRFIHLDVRSTRAYWIDKSGPGERAKYVRGKQKKKKAKMKSESLPDAEAKHDAESEPENTETEH